MNLTDDIRFLKGVGEQRALQFERLHIYNINDILTHFPRDYEDRRNTTKIRNVMLDEKNIIRAFVKTKPSVISFGKVKISNLKDKDNG